MPKIRLLLVGDADELIVADQFTADAANMTLQEMAELGGTLVEIEMRAALGEDEDRITSFALKSTGGDGFKMSGSALNRARARVLIERWPESLGPFVGTRAAALLDSDDADDIEAAFRAFPASLHGSISAWMARKMYPTIADSPDFMKALRDKQQPSEAATTA